MIVGFSGSRNGLSLPQAAVVVEVLADADEFHHGDCVGADEAAHRLARSVGVRTVGHPPTYRGLRAFCDVDEERPPLPFLQRNRRIVAETDLLVACPAEAFEVIRSGTWTTIRYARAAKRPVVVVSRDGSRVQVAGG